MREICNRHDLVADLAAKGARFLMRTLQKLLQQPELVHDFERRGVDRVAPEVAQKIGVLFEHQNRNPRSSEQKPQHHAGGAAAGDAAPHR